MKTSISITAIALAFGMIACSKESTPEIQTSSLDTASVVEVTKKSEVPISNTERTVVFLAGFDKGSSTFYNDAKTYFENEKVEIVESAFSLQEIILWLNMNYNSMPFSNVHIVNKTKLNQMSLETTVKGEQITNYTLHEAMQDGTLPVLKNVLVSDANLILHSSGIGTNKELLSSLKDVFSIHITPKVIASENAVVFGSEYAPKYMAKTFYAFYPTAQSPGRVDMAKQFSTRYPEADIDWLSAMNNSSERYLGDVYSYKFNVPVRWDIDFFGDEEVPSFNTRKELITWMKNHDEISAELEALGIPLEKFRWYQTEKNDTLIIKGKATVICVLEPIMNLAYPNEYMKPSIDNIRLYDTL
ncbi:hypothetical protein KH5_16920 [Urechidicola sp. KH5]